MQQDVTSSLGHELVDWVVGKVGQAVDLLLRHVWVMGVGCQILQEWSDASQSIPSKS